jgi:predicted DNA-binding protein (UPF0251 family)
LFKYYNYCKNLYIISAKYEENRTYDTVLAETRHLKQRQPVESYVISELLREKANVELVRRILKKLDKETLAEYIINSVLSKATEYKQKIPVSIFEVRVLGPLETVVKYLKEELKLANNEIAKLLGKSQQSIWTSYRNANKKHHERLKPRYSQYDMPVSEFIHRLSILENITLYLHDKHNLKLSKIANILKRDQTTIWHTYAKARKRMQK